MTISRREAFRVSGVALAGVSTGVLAPESLLALTQGARGAPAAPGTLVDVKPRELAKLELTSDGSAVMFDAKQAGTISDPNLWRYTKNQPPAIEYDYRKLKLSVDSRGTAMKQGTVVFSDLEKLPGYSYTVLLQCGSQNPRGIVKWTGVRFTEFCKMLGVQPSAQYVRFVGADGYFTEEDMKTVMHPQVVLAWMMNDQPLAPKYGAPLRLVIPFRYGARSMKALSEILFTASSFPHPKPTAGA